MKDDNCKYKFLGAPFVNTDGTTCFFHIFNINNKKEFVLVSSSNIIILAPATDEGYVRAMAYINKEGYNLAPPRLC